MSMQCKSCGKPTPDTSKFCPYCGAATQACDTAETLEDANLTQQGTQPSTPQGTQQVLQQTAQQTMQQTAQQVSPYAQSGQFAQVPPYGQAAPAVQYAQNPQSYGQNYYGQPYQTQPYGQAAGQFPGQAPGQPYQYETAQIPQKKKRSKLPFIIGAAALVVVAAVFIVLFAIGAFGAEKPKNTLDALVKGSQNIVDASSGTFEIDYGSVINSTVKFELGDDLKSSKFMATVDFDGYGDVGIAYTDDTMIVYMDGSSDGAYSSGTLEVTSVVDGLNQLMQDEYDIDIDFNKLVKNGKYNSEYMAEVEQALADVGYYDSTGIDEDTSAALGKIIADFCNKEMIKDEVQEDFVDEDEPDTKGNMTLYSTRIDIVGFIEALSDYAASQNENEEASDLLVDSCDQMLSSMPDDIGDIIIEVGLTDNKLAELTVGFSYMGVSVSVDMKISDINNTKLSDDDDFNSIMDMNPDQSEDLLELVDDQGSRDSFSSIF